MTADALLFLQWFTQNIWPFFTDWNIPGTAMSPAQLLFFILLVSALIPFIIGFIQGLTS